MNKNEIHDFWIRTKDSAAAKGITMTSVYTTLGLIPNNAAGWAKRDNLPPVDICLKMSWILGVDINYLLWGDSPPVKEDLVLASRISKKLEEEGTPDLESRLKKIEEELKIIRNDGKGSAK